MPQPRHAATHLDLYEVLGEQGRLVEHLPGFTQRSEQLAMAQSISSAIAERRALIVEAGTGVGKTFAYLVPALLAGRRTVISTGTRSLQDQLFRRDLPMISGVLGRPVRIALLKGRANYLCEQRLDLAMTQGQARGLMRSLAMSLRKVKMWSMQTRHGDISELAAVAESDPIWPWVTSTRDNCLGTDCGFFERCHLMAARRAALAADIVVVNHHLLMADLLLKENGFGDLLPGAEVVIVDEAHQLPEVATQALGTVFTARQLREFVKDVSSAAVAVKLAALSTRQLELLHSLESQAELGSQALNGLAEHVEVQRWPDTLLEAVADSHQTLLDFAAGIGAAAESTEVRGVRERALDLAARCELFIEQPTSIESSAAVRWATLNKSGFSLHHAPVDIAKPLGELIAKQGGAWIMTSATLAVGSDLQHFARRVGISEGRTEQFGSPFDYARQALLYLPRGLDMPTTPQHTRQVVQAALPVLAASGGRAFLLFTSYRALREAAAQLRHMWRDDAPYPLLVQGEAPRDVLLKQFREHGNAVLLGTGTFWEGVDVKGQALCVVVIDKLPFAVPDEPITKARLAAIEQRGGNAFMEEQVPQAVVALKQGVGRLIRDAKDFGVIMLCDQRLMTRSYGRVFLDSLPPMPRTHNLTEVQTFLQRHLSAIEGATHC